MKKKQSNPEESTILEPENKPDIFVLRHFLNEMRLKKTIFESTEDLIDYLNFTIRVLIKNIQSEYMSGYIKAKRMPNIDNLLPFIDAFAFRDNEVIEDFPLEGRNVVSFPHEHKKMLPAFKDIKYNGFRSDWHKPDIIDGFYFPELDLVIIHNGQHHTAATWEDAYKGVYAHVKNISLEKVLDVVKISEDDEFWEFDSKKKIIEDSRFAMILEVYRKRRELEKKTEDDVAAT